jgi:hypothetical protein
MTHYSRIARIVIDASAATHDDEVAFWREATGVALQRYERYPQYHGGPLADSMGLLTQQLGDGEARVHLDIHTTDRAAEVARLTALGASVVRAAEYWTVMSDPAGLLFCVVPDERLDAGNAQAWPG